MRLLTAEDVARTLDPRALVDALRDGFKAGATVPLRHHHSVPDDKNATGMLLLMPAWRKRGYLGVKIATVFTENPKRGLSSVMGVYYLCDGETGAPASGHGRHGTHAPAHSGSLGVGSGLLGASRRQDLAGSGYWRTGATFHHRASHGTEL